MATPPKQLKNDESSSDSDIPLMLLPPKHRDKMEYHRKVGSFNGWNSLRYQAKNRDSLSHFKLNCRFENPNNLTKFLRVQKTLTGIELPVYNQLRRRVRKQLPTLKCLRKVEISPSSKMNNRDLEEFAIELRGCLPSMQEFYLNFLKAHRDRRDRNREEGLTSVALHLGQNFKRQKNLRLFSFSIENHDSIRDSGILFLTSQASNNIKKLEHFILRICNCRVISAAVFENVTQRLKNSTTLKKLTLENTDAHFFDREEYGDESQASALDGLAKSIGENLKGLTHLCLVLTSHWRSNSWFLNNGFQTFTTQVVKNLNALEHLQLEFGNTEIDDEKFQFFIDAIQESLPMLKNLSLDLSQNPNITDESIKKLSKLIRNHLTAIEEVNLYFDNCPGITSKGAKILKRLNRI